MHLDCSEYTQRNKTYQRVLLRTSYREGGKVRKRTLANLSGCSANEIAAIKLALQHKDNLEKCFNLNNSFSITPGVSIGAIAAVLQVAKELNIDKALGNSEDGKMALWQVMARVLEQGSRLSATRLANVHAGLELLKMQPFNEDHLYSNLNWIEENQVKIENRLFKQLSNKTLFLYDVTSSYLEGEHNELAEYGYNRDRKKGKKQIVIGLLTDSEGEPIAVEVFKGNTPDTETVTSQIQKLKTKFGVSNITLVGDRGMIKAPQIELLKSEQFNYITAITKPQIQSLIAGDIIQLSFFDIDLTEITHEGLRYILRKNPTRAKEIQSSRTRKLDSLEKLCTKQNNYLRDHPKASPKTAMKKISEKITAMKLSWVTASISDRTIILSKDKDSLEKLSKLDGCYCLKTDLPSSISKEVIHARYKDLKYVEADFRISKTTALEVRPIFLRKAERTKGYLLVTMLACKIIRRLQKHWKNFDLTVPEALTQLSSLCAQTITCNGVAINKIPTPNPTQKNLLDAATVSLPEFLPNRINNVVTRKKLNEARKPA